MTLSLLIDSQLVKLRNLRGGYESHNFRVDVNSPIELDSRKNYRAAMNRLIAMTYSWYNVAAALNNNNRRSLENSVFP